MCYSLNFIIFAMVELRDNKVIDFGYLSLVYLVTYVHDLIFTFISTHITLGSIIAFCNLQIITVTVVAE